MAKTQLQLEEFIPFRLSFTSNLVSDRIAGTYEALFGLTIPQWRLIAVTAEADGISQAEIATRTRMDKVTVSRAAIGLVERGLLARQSNARDGRSHLLVLTGDGRRLYEQIAPKALELERRMFANFTKAEVETLLAMLRKIDAETLRLDERV